MLRFVVILGLLAGLSREPLAAGLATGVQAADPTEGLCEGEPPAGGQWRCGPRGRDLVIISAAYGTADLGDGDDLTGLTLSAGLWDESQDIFGRVLYWAHMSTSDQRDYATVGANLGFFIISIGPVRIVPEFKLGVGYEWSTPSGGFEALPGVGLEVAAWLGNTFQLAVGADRDFGSHTGTRNQLMFSIRWSPKYWANNATPPNNALQRTHSRVTPRAERLHGSRHAARR